MELDQEAQAKPAAAAKGGFSLGLDGLSGVERGIEGGWQGYACLSSDPRGEPKRKRRACFGCLGADDEGRWALRRLVRAGGGKSGVLVQERRRRRNSAQTPAVFSVQLGSTRSIPSATTSSIPVVLSNTDSCPFCWLCSKKARPLFVLLNTLYGLGREPGDVWRAVKASRHEGLREGTIEFSLVREGMIYNKSRLRTPGSREGG